MNRERAQLILLAYRRGANVAPDSELAEALHLVGRDPALAAWLEETLRVDDLIRARLRGVPAPAAMRRAILARGTPVALARRWQPLGRWALAAGLVASLGLASLWIPRPGSDIPTAASRADFTALQPELARFLSEGRYKLQLRSDNLADVRTFLARARPELSLPVPPALETLRTYGCQVFDLRGTRVTLICFRTHDVGVLHLFVIDADELHNPPPLIRQFGEMGAWTTCAWTQNGQALLFFAKATEAQVRRVLAS